MVRRRKEDTWARLASRGMCSDGVVSPPVCRHRGVPAGGVVPEQCHTLGATANLLQGRSRMVAPGLNAQRMAVWSTYRAPPLCCHVPRALLRSVLCDVTPIISHNCLPPNK